MVQKYYAVRVGVQPGIYTNWNECKKNVIGYSGAIYKSFTTEEDAIIFMNQSPIQPNNDEESEMCCTAYVDGSYNEKTGRYGSGFYFKDYNGIINEFSFARYNPFCASMRNVAGELDAAIQAVEYAISINAKCIKIYYDYSGIECWAMGYWNCNNPNTQIYQEIMQNFMKIIDIKFIKVKGHTGDFGNERADYLAKLSCGIIEEKKET